MLVTDAGKTLGIQDSPRIDGAENLMFLNVPKFYLQDLIHNRNMVAYSPNHFQSYIVYCLFK
jgi:hypothetical protein